MKTIDNILDNCLEIEGLLSLLASQRTAASKSVHTLLITKVTTLYNDILALEHQPVTLDASQNESKLNVIAESTISEEIEDADVKADIPANNLLSGSMVRNDIFPVKLTINDRYRFKNELFDGNQTDFDEALRVISSMSTIDEVMTYLYDDLCFDSENDVVKDFIATLNHKG